MGPCLFFLYFFFFFSISFSSFYLSVICLFISATKSKNKIILIQDRQKLTIEKNKLTAFEDNGILNIIIKSVYEKIFLTIKIINVNMKKKSLKILSDQKEKVKSLLNK